MNQLAPNKGRKSAFYARNRASIVLSAQKLLAQSAVPFTIEEVAAEADMAASTIYKHFETKELLVETAIVTAMADWEIWAKERSSELTESLDQLVAPMLLFIAMPKTHPLNAQIAVNNQPALDHLEPQITKNLKIHIKKLAKVGELKIDNVDDRLANLIACIQSAFRQAILGKESQAVKQITLALTLIGISEKDAQRQVASLAKSLKLFRR